MQPSSTFHSVTHLVQVLEPDPDRPLLVLYPPHSPDNLFQYPQTLLPLAYRGLPFLFHPSQLLLQLPYPSDLALLTLVQARQRSRQIFNFLDLLHQIRC